MGHFPHYIGAKNYRLKRYILWQAGHYHYQITRAQTGKSGGFELIKDMPDTRYEAACRAFDLFPR